MVMKPDNEHCKGKHSDRLAPARRGNGIAKTSRRTQPTVDAPVRRSRRLAVKPPIGCIESENRAGWNRLLTHRKLRSRPYTYRLHPLAGDRKWYCQRPHKSRPLSRCRGVSRSICKLFSNQWTLIPPSSISLRLATYILKTALVRARGAYPQSDTLSKAKYVSGHRRAQLGFVTVSWSTVGDLIRIGMFFCEGEVVESLRATFCSQIIRRRKWMNDAFSNDRLKGADFVATRRLNRAQADNKNNAYAVPFSASFSKPKDAAMTKQDSVDTPLAEENLPETNEQNAGRSLSKDEDEAIAVGPL
nr:hypothetical protein CFP56_63081 [Quercus suber]